jgi:hypothetical protein
MSDEVEQTSKVISHRQQIREEKHRRYNQRREKSDEDSPDLKAYLTGAFNELCTPYGDPILRPRNWIDEVYGVFPPNEVSDYATAGVYDHIVKAIAARRVMVARITELNQQMSQSSAKKLQLDHEQQELRKKMRELEKLRSERVKPQAQEIREFPDAVDESTHCVKQVVIIQNGVFFIARCTNKCIQGSARCQIHTSLEDLERTMREAATSVPVAKPKPQRKPRQTYASVTTKPTEDDAEGVADICGDVDN